MNEKKYSTTQASKLAGVSRRALTGYAQAGQIEFERNDIGHYFWSEEAIEKAKKLKHSNTIGRCRDKQEEEVMAQVAKELDECSNKGGLYVPVSSTNASYQQGYLNGYLAGAKDVRGKRVSKGFIKGLEFALKQMKGGE
jgi:DNA-binding transcriptional MerR regulator